MFFLPLIAVEHQRFAVAFVRKALTRIGAKTEWLAAQAGVTVQAVSRQFSDDYQLRLPLLTAQERAVQAEIAYSWLEALGEIQEQRALSLEAVRKRRKQMARAQLIAKERTA